MKESLRDWGLLVLRVGVGSIFMAHGWPKLAGGASTWEKLGHATKFVGITFAPTFFGFMAATTEFFGGLLVALGLFFRPALALLFMTMAVALSMHLGKGDGYTQWSNSATSAVIFLAMLLTGPGRFRVDAWLRGKG